MGRRTTPLYSVCYVLRTRNSHNHFFNKRDVSYLICAGHCPADVQNIIFFRRYILCSVPAGGKKIIIFEIMFLLSLKD